MLICQLACLTLLSNFCLMVFLISGFVYFQFFNHLIFILSEHNTYNIYQRTCCPWSHGLRQKKSLSVAVPPAPVRVPSQRPLAPSFASVTSVANDKGDNEMILGAVHRSPGICLKAEENSRKPQLGDHLMKGLCDQSSPQMGTLSSK